MNIDGLLTLLQRINIEFEIIILTECWLSHVASPPILDSYNSYTTTADKLYNQNDGLLIYVKSNIKHSIEEPHFLEANCMIIKLGLDTVVIGIYRPHCFKHDATKFLKSLDELLFNFKSYQNIIIIGDINIDIATNNNDKISDEYLNLTASHGLLPAFTMPTRLNTCIDHVILKTNKPAKASVIESAVTDHSAVAVSLQTTNRNKNQQIISKINYTTLENDMNKVNFDIIYDLTCPNKVANLIVDLISGALVANTQILRIPHRRLAIKPWITLGILRCMRNRDNMHSKLKSHPNNDVLRKTYKRYRNYCNDLLKKLKRQYETNEIQKAGKNSKKIWEIVKRNTNINVSKDSSKELLSLSSSPQSSVDEVNTYFTNIGSSLAGKILQNNNHHQQASLPPTYLTSMVLLETDYAEVADTITSLKNDCSKGWDNIPSKILKLYKHILVVPITYLCNLCINSGIFPDAFKKSIVRPIFKSGTRDRVTNYRPISILSSLSKILERIMNKRLTNYLESNSLLSSQQFGFRAGKSTDAAVHELTDHLVQNIDSGKKCIGVFLDLAKAFDTVSIPLLINKLEAMGIRDKQLQLFKSYLSGRKQSVRIDEFTSKEETINYGIPQGSILGPTLFLVYANDLCSMSLTNGKILSFADDTALVFTGDNWQETFKIAQIGLDKVTNWLNQNILTLNVDKTKYLKFGIRSTSTALPNTSEYFLIVHNCQMDNRGLCGCPKLDSVNSLRYLGVIIDHNLNFKQHIETLTIRTRKLIFIFKSLRNIAPFNIIKTIYFALCQSIFSYCITSWGGAAKTNLERIEIAQRAILKVATFKKRLFPTFDLFQEWKVLTIRQLFILHTVMKQHANQYYDKSIKQTKRRFDRICHIVRCRTEFAKKFIRYQGPQLYNKINRVLDVYPLTKQLFKVTVTNWLMTKDYDSTENLLDNLI